MKPLVSIIMPAYNSEKYIAQAITSVIEQTYVNWELLITDDCSTDETKKIIQEYTSRDTRIRPIFSEKNSGKPSIAKNSALPFIKGELIAFLDSDDFWMKDKLSLQIQKLRSDPSLALVYTGGYWVDQNNNTIKSFLPKYPDGMNLKNMLIKYELNNQSVMITKEALDNTRQEFNSTILIGEDYNLFMHIIANYKTASIADYLINYRIHNNALTKNKKQLSDGVLVTLQELHKTHGIFWKYPLLSLLTYVKAIRFKYIKKVWR